MPALAQTALPGQGGTTGPAMTGPVVPKPALPVKPAAPAMAMAMSAPVNINTATASQLDAVPQIGQKRADQIIKGRPYKSLDELVSKKVLSKGIFDKIKSRLTV